MILNRFDFVFSYWIFFWYLCYEARITQYNPIVALYFGILENLAVLCAMLYYNNSNEQVFSFCFLVFCFKVFPLWSLRNTKYSIYDMYTMIVLFLVYLFWLFINRVQLKTMWLKTLQNIQKNKPLGPFMSFIAYLTNKKDIKK
jgi:hypothetical protein